MEYRQFEKLGVEASLLGFGCMRLPKHRDGTINYEKAERLVDMAYQSGVNYFDTAYNYHDRESEKFIGKALDKYERNSYFLATKLPTGMVESLDQAKAIFEEQLVKLHKDYVDFYLLHALNRNRFEKMVNLGVPEHFDKMKEEGKIRYFGFSFHDDYEVFSRILNYRDWDFCQIQLNYMDTEIQAGMKGYKLTEKLNVPLIIMEPVKGGGLAKLPQSSAKYFKTLASENSITSWALRWVASLPNVRVVLSGMSNEKQVYDNLNTFRNFKELDEAEKQAVINVTQAMRKRMKNGCTGCNYCMPCPAGVNIPANFKIWNNYGIYRLAGETKWYWQHTDEKSRAKNCIECGKCEILCPQKINIRENLKQLQVELDALK